MQEKTIAHQLRTITVPYDESRAWTVQDEQLVQAYIALHDYEWNLQMTFGKLSENYSKLENKLNGVSEALPLLKQKLNQLSHAGNEAFDQLVMRNFMPLDDFTQRLLQMMQEINNYHYSLEEVNSIANENAKPFSDILDELYDGRAWDTFSKTKLAHSQIYEVNAVDIVLFDQEQARFKGWANAYGLNRNSYIDYFNKVVDHLNLLQAETNVQYAVWDGILKRMRWAQLIKEKEMQFNKVSMN